MMMGNTHTQYHYDGVRVRGLDGGVQIHVIAPCVVRLQPGLAGRGALGACPIRRGTSFVETTFR
jgi:hypothetical protein